MIRGGYGIYYEIGNGDESNANGAEGNPPVSLGPTLYNLVGYGSIQPINSASSQPIGPGFFQAIPLHEKYPSVQQFSFGVEHEFPGKNLFSLSYVGSQGRHLATQRNQDHVPHGRWNRSHSLARGYPGMFGYMGRNPLTGPGVNNWDLALMKDFATLVPRRAVHPAISLGDVQYFQSHPVSGR